MAVLSRGVLWWYAKSPTVQSKQQHVLPKGRRTQKQAKTYVLSRKFNLSQWPKVMRPKRMHGRNMHFTQATNTPSSLLQP